MTNYESSIRWLTALPVYNEVKHLTEVLDEVLQYSPEVLVVDDGSTDGTAELLQKYPTVHLLTHKPNKGYGAALKTAFDFAVRKGYDVVVTIDCDGQHQPRLIRDFVRASEHADIVSGSRYLQDFAGDNPAPEQRRKINEELTKELNRRLGLRLTDAFCGFKAYRGEALAKLELTDNGYAMPLELWVQAASIELEIVELPVPRIYLEEARSFGGALDDAARRLAYYRETVDRALANIKAAGWRMPVGRPIPAAAECDPSVPAGICGDRAG